ncbi:probable salivary secreted peptide [Monomorium pharaonis]|uniref:probable salivary secreted peptide n=1 Tax=Monomorium pharaonis TaxID=307658 RepID=UPI00063FB8A6|nr:probable salivary secreted peptide [Monomorium pharaonis]
MSAYKYIIALAVLVAALLTVSTVPSANGAVASYAPANKSNHLIVGYRMPGDRLVLRQSIYKKAEWMKVQVVEKNFNVSRWERITLIQALDQQTNGTGAFPSIVRGGVGYNNVTLKFKSQRGYAINFVVQLYSRP